MLSLLLLSGGVFAQGANGVAADKEWTSGNSADDGVSKDQRTITVTVNDPDINQPNSLTETADRFLEDYEIAGSTTVTFYVANFPIADRTGDGIVNAMDVSVVPDLDESTATSTITGVEAVIVDSSNGAVTIRNTAGQTDFRLIFNSAVVNTTTDSDGNETVLVRSSSDPEGLKLRLTERTPTGGESRIVGKYSAKFIVASAVPDGLASGFSSTFDENGVGVNLDGVAATSDSVDVALYPAVYKVFDGTNGGSRVGENDTPLTRFELSGDSGETFTTANAVLVTETGDATTTPSRFATLITGGTWNEADFVTSPGDGIDLNGDDSTTTEGVTVAFYEAHYNADLDGGGATGADDGGLDDAVTTYNAALFPEGKLPVLEVSAADQVTIVYSDLDNKGKRTGGTARDSVRIESELPGFANADPVSGTNTINRSPNLSADITDAASGVKADTIVFRIGTWIDRVQTDEDGDEQARDGKAQMNEVTPSGTDFTALPGGDVSTATIAGGVRASMTLPQEKEDVNLAWWVIAKDVAGNELVSDYVTLRIDTSPPVFTDAYTGQTLGKGGVPNEGASVRTSVRVEFSEMLEPSSVEANDFRVGGALPSNANVSGSNVYLTVAAQAPDAAPEVELVGEVADLSGNALQAGPKQTAADSIKPAVAAVLSGSLTSGDVAITITSDEDIAGAPSVRAQFVYEGEVDNPDYDKAKADAADADADLEYEVSEKIPATLVSGKTVLGVTSPSARVWTTTISKNEVPTEVIGKSGVINLLVTAPDSTGNGGTAGVNLEPADGSKVVPDGVSTKNAVSYELDVFFNGGPDGAGSIDPVFTVSGDDAATEDRETSQTGPFVQIEFAGEAKNEYAGDSNDMVTLTSLTLKETTSDGTEGQSVNMMGNEVRRSNSEFVLPLQGLTLGSTYTITVNGTDAAGNTYADGDLRSVTFEVVPRPGVTIRLQPGMNLVSFPADPRGARHQRGVRRRLRRGRGAVLRPVPRRAVADFPAQR